MFSLESIADIGILILYLLLPILVLYIIYLMLTKPFKYMGFSTVEAIIIVFISLIFRFDIIIMGFSVSNIYLFSYNNWLVSINIGGAVIPIILSIYLAHKNKIQIEKIVFGILIVAVIAYFVTRVVVTKGIVASFPYWLLPAVCASVISVAFSWNSFKKAAPLAYISGTIGVLFGADVLRLPELLSYSIETSRNAILGGANVFDMIYLTGILAVIIDGLIMFKQRSKEGIN